LVLVGLLAGAAKFPWLTKGISVYDKGISVYDIIIAFLFGVCGEARKVCKAC
jgi:hypothetical protein